MSAFTTLLHFLSRIFCLPSRIFYLLSAFTKLLLRQATSVRHSESFCICKDSLTFAFTILLHFLLSSSLSSRIYCFAGQPSVCLCIGQAASYLHFMGLLSNSKSDEEPCCHANHLIVSQQWARAWGCSVSV
jgi:hypothetical protein